MHSFHGYVEVHVDGIWGSVCNQNWTDKNAFVACKQMGYAGITLKKQQILPQRNL
ncbi:hypothetical protein DPMN_136157 [Dreissena polymorpha]|uniref:SRCR domain-containing protein n=1 Tax=Dreissena polymorpha TaxID=45954 RepID=A0A9D4G283_DREPO|nr:hypothetical protein DPMN_136157 [Dreissena polymorpha]